ncbi:hypothetical protein EFK50_09765 [Nocardioides marmoriginsengisoli]|uniref:UGSC-like domain-containing protein n=1 Tax=Nocardioides marmoriginsengisoli TaxID=661483 RepID=A0A3N0CF62_9ACTN|nr:hypothetical protein [Nocardioides marmoriginsengisoli]RNL62092.1 hypothetical protein EFK50_09765 [Nocardioides marmoriginsengisoli]
MTVHETGQLIETGIDVVSPLGMVAREASSVAPSPPGREGLQVALVSNGKANATELLDAVALRLADLLPGLRVVHYRKPSVSVAPTDEDLEQIIATADAAVAAIGDCGSCSSRTMRDAIELEWSGVPSVAIVADALLGPVEFMRKLSGMPDYPFCVTEFPVGNLTPEELGERARVLAPRIVELLFEGRPDGDSARPRGAVEPVPAVPPADSTRSYRGHEPALTDFYQQGWTDGLPVVVPTVERVEEMLAGAGLTGDEVIFQVPTRNSLTVTTRLAAANAVMAGCGPEHFQLVLAAARALGRPQYNLHGHTATLSGAQQVMVVNGPIRHRLGINSGEGALGPGTRANNAVGRALRLIIRNGCRSVHGQFDRSTFGHPGRFSWCFGEAEEKSPWPSLAVELGQPAGTDTVSLFASVWQASTISHTRDAEQLLDEIGLGARTGCHVNWLHQEVANDSSFFAVRPFVFVVGHQHAQVLVDGGYDDKPRLSAAIYDRLVRPDDTLRPASIADPDNVRIVYVHGTGMQQTWFFAPFQSHELTLEPVG